jgi:murein DD-endopeptidase MepM/ murein hydrolase activator NlpD
MRFKQSRFTKMLIEVNRLDPTDFKRWVFCTGMLFNSPDKWWGDYGRRDFPHEGIDFCLYHGRSGQMFRLDEKTRIPVMHNGVVRAVFTDYLGRAVVIEHQNTQADGSKLLSTYAHTRPLDGIEPGAVLKAGDVIATIADTQHSKANILPHLHFSLGRPAPNLAYDAFVWNDMRNPESVVLLNPLGLIDWPSQVLNLQDCSRMQGKAEIDRTGR